MNQESRNIFSQSSFRESAPCHNGEKKLIRWDVCRKKKHPGEDFKIDHNIFFHACQFGKRKSGDYIDTISIR